jgi:hypothetical protein
MDCASPPCPSSASMPLPSLAPVALFDLHAGVCVRVLSRRQTPLRASVRTVAARLTTPPGVTVLLDLVCAARAVRRGGAAAVLQPQQLQLVRAAAEHVRLQARSVRRRRAAVHGRGSTVRAPPLSARRAPRAGGASPRFVSCCSSVVVTRRRCCRRRELLWGAVGRSRRSERDGGTSVAVFLVFLVSLVSLVAHASVTPAACTLHAVTPLSLVPRARCIAPPPHHHRACVTVTVTVTLRRRSW